MKQNKPPVMSRHLFVCCRTKVKVITWFFLVVRYSAVVSHQQPERGRRRGSGHAHILQQPHTPRISAIHKPPLRVGQRCRSGANQKQRRACGAAGPAPEKWRPGPQEDQSGKYNRSPASCTLPHPRFRSRPVICNDHGQRGQIVQVKKMYNKNRERIKFWHLSSLLS